MPNARNKIIEGLSLATSKKDMVQFVSKTFYNRFTKFIDKIGIKNYSSGDIIIRIHETDTVGEFSSIYLKSGFKITILPWEDDVAFCLKKSDFYRQQSFLSPTLHYWLLGREVSFSDTRIDWSVLKAVYAVCREIFYDVGKYCKPLNLDPDKTKAVLRNVLKGRNLKSASDVKSFLNNNPGIKDIMSSMAMDIEGKNSGNLKVRTTDPYVRGVDDENYYTMLVLDSRGRNLWLGRVGWTVLRTNSSLFVISGMNIKNIHKALDVEIPKFITNLY